MFGLLEREPLAVDKIRTNVSEALATPLPDLLSDQLRQADVLLQERDMLLDGRRISNVPREQRRVYADRLNTVEGELEGRHAMARAIREGYDPYSIPNTYYVSEFDHPRSRDISSIAGAVKGWMLVGMPITAIGGCAVIHSEVSGAVVVQAALAVATWGVEAAFSSKSVTRGVDLGLEFKTPIPSNILEKYQLAKSTGLFEAYLVAGPNFEDFRVTRTMLTEPVMVGLIRANKREKIVFNTTSRQRAGGHEDLGQRERFPGVVIKNANAFLIGHWDLTQDRQAAGLSF